MNRFPGIELALLTFFFAAAAPGFFPVAAAEEIHYDSANRRDPFIPLVGPGGVVGHAFNPTDLKVEGIIFDPAHGSLVLINGDFYKQGDRVQNATLVSIFKDRVVLVQDDQNKVLWLREEIAEEGKKKDAKPADAPAKK